MDGPTRLVRRSRLIGSVCYYTVPTSASRQCKGDPDGQCYDGQDPGGCGRRAGHGLGALGQAAAPRRAIERVSGSVYSATNNNHRTVFLVTPEGILLGDPINVDFSKWLKAELATRFKVPVRYVVYSHHHWDHASGGEVFADTAKFVGHANMLTALAMPPASTTLAQVTGEFEALAKQDKTATA